MPLDAEESVARLRRFVRLLGWQAPLRLYQHQIGADAAPRNLRGRVIRWYETGVSNGGKLDCFLRQLIPSPISLGPEESFPPTAQHIGPVVGPRGFWGVTVLRTYV